MCSSPNRFYEKKKKKSFPTRNPINHDHHDTNTNFHTSLFTKCLNTTTL